MPTSFFVLSGVHIHLTCRMIEVNHSIVITIQLEYYCHALCCKTLLHAGHSELVGSVIPMTSFFSQPSHSPTSATLHFLTEEQLLNSTHFTPIAMDECQATGHWNDSEPFGCNEPPDGMQFHFNNEKEN